MVKINTIIIIGVIIIFGSCNRAYSDGQDLAENLCENYDPISDKIELKGAYEIKLADKYCYIVPEEFPEFRSGFIDYLTNHCIDYKERLINWKDIGGAGL